ncbi:BMP family ABC transporter substrate-binding protein [uncultured Clostridium sp.]|uniref:BMP family lipoprotein n=1 Tax=uncultured Clostridium sp. TaxID=59620 RepID=UPI002605B057|nr:BMP family ABC transporter substrate-binding protein [uncultured Clostridium sp.]
MKRKVLAMAMTLLMATGILAGCGGASGDDSDKKDAMNVGMVTDVGTIDDKSFNQGTWEGILEAKKELGVKEKYLQPGGQTKADYLTEINNMYDADFKFIVAPGYKFEQAIYEAQDKYTDAKFVLIDGSPNDGAEKDPKSKVGDNTVSIFYAEEQSGFLAGVAATVELKTGDLGFIGGLEIPPVQKFNWGFQQGVEYANKNLGAKVTLKKENIKYSNSFEDVALGQQIAATMYDRGVKAIFASAGKVGVGVITEAKTRAKSGKDAWVIGVDVDQFEEGKYEGDKSVILTSATKKIGKSAFDMVKSEQDGKFPGGETLTYDVKNDGVGIPETNPNLSDETIKTVNEVKEKMKSDEIKVSAEKGDLIA